MPFPKAGSAVSRPDLGVAVDEFKLDSPTLGFIGPQVMPALPVSKQASEFTVIPKEALLAGGDTRRAMRGFYNRSDFEFERGFYATHENGWEEVLDDREVNLYKNLFSAELVASKRATGIILRNQEMRIASKVFNATNFTAHAVTNEWDDKTNATPLDDVATGKKAIRSACGMLPNTLIISYSTMQDLKRNAQIVDLLKYTFPGEDINTMSAMQLAHILDVPKVLVGGAVKNTANKAQDAVIADIWSNEYAMLTITSDSDDMSEPCLGRTFVWDDESGGGEGNTIVEQYRSEGNRSDIYRVRHDTDERLIMSYTEAGAVQSNIAAAVSYLFSNITT